MKISVITVCKNSEQYIEKAIKSVVNQTYGNIEYIIVDGDSQDKTKEIVSRYKDSVAKFTSELDSGVYAAMNKGINLASGDFIYFLNSDDYFVDENVIQDVVNFLLSHPECDILYGNIDVSYEYDKYHCTILLPQPDVIRDHLILDFICHQALFAKSELFLKFSLFDEKYEYAADYKWLLQMLQNQCQFLYYSRTIVSYYLGGISGNIANQKASRAEIFAIQNESPIYQDSYWLSQRILKFQDAIMANIDQSAYFTPLEMQLEEAKNMINAMKTSKFWKLRDAWVKFKKFVGLPV